MKTHLFHPNKANAALCNVKPSEKNWARKDYCTTDPCKVTCKSCIMLYLKLDPKYQKAKPASIANGSGNSRVTVNHQKIKP